MLSDLIILSSSNVTFTLECIECGVSERRFFQVSVKDLNRTKEWNAKSQPTALREDFVHLAESSLRHRQIAIKCLAKETRRKHTLSMVPNNSSQETMTRTNASTPGSPKYETTIPTTGSWRQEALNSSLMISSQNSDEETAESMKIKF